MSITSISSSWCGVPRSSSPRVSASPRRWTTWKRPCHASTGRTPTPSSGSRRICCVVSWRCTTLRIDLIEEFKYDFCGIKGQRELTEHFATADVAEAFLNDPYGPDGAPKPSVVCSTEADSDAALTMQIFKHLSGTPVLFADVRHYHQDLGVWDLCNSGEHATYFAGRSTDPKVNLSRTEFRPQGFYFPAGGASVYHIAAPGRVTLARLTRHDGRYVMTVVPAEFVDFGARNHEIAAISQDNWPHAFARFDCSVETFIANFHCNHIHGVYGDVVAELEQLCSVLGIECRVLRD